MMSSRLASCSSPPVGRRTTCIRAGDVASRPFHTRLPQPAAVRHGHRLLQQRPVTTAAAPAPAPAAGAAAAAPTAPASGSATAPVVLVLPAGQQPGWRDKLALHNTLTRQKERFTTRAESPNRVQMYVCGVTVYDLSHIGHARVYVSFDVLYRLLLALGYDVQYVRNFTDIDDKIIARASQQGVDCAALCDRYIAEFGADMDALGCLPPSLQPRATQYVPQIIDTIRDILAAGHGYVVDGGDVYFDVPSLPDYGRLSGRAADDNRAGERVAVDERKRSPADFALWKAAKPGEPWWESPWGRGRPGWHIECSSMIAATMGPVIDIHGGGRDLVFPHHENEIAQSQAAAAAAAAAKCSCCTGGRHHQQPGDASSPSSSSPSSPPPPPSSSSTEPSPQQQQQPFDFVRYWLHNGFVNIDNEKMSKSLGNFFTIRDVLGRYHPLCLRWFLLNCQYRQPVSYSSRGLDEAADRLYYIYQALADVQSALAAAGPAGGEAAAAAAAELAAGAGPAAATVSEALAALVDDLNTPLALSSLSSPLKAVNDLLTTKAGKKAPNRLAALAGHQLAIATVLRLLGMTAGSSSSSSAAELEAVLAEMRALALTRVGVSAQQVDDAIAARAAARSAKDFATGDRIRLELAAKGILIMDTPTGTSWRPGLVQEAPAA